MEFSFDPSDDALRRQMRDWLRANRPTEPRPHYGQGMREFDLRWQCRKFDAGWGAIAWPERYGGRGLTLTQQMIWYEECSAAGAPSIGSLSVTLQHAASTLMECGTEAQRAFHLPRILRGEVMWCQGFSEPNAGSDLAALRTAARADGDTLVVNGQKIWSSNADVADYQMLLVRSDPASSRHKGLSWVICDLKTPGISIRPIRTMDHGAHYCEVFYDDVRIPLSNVVGEVNGGWAVTIKTLISERLSNALLLPSVLTQLVEKLRERWMAAAARTSVSDIPMRLAKARAEAAALRSMTYMTISRARERPADGAEAAMLFMVFGELLLRVRSLGLEILQGESIEAGKSLDEWTIGYLGDRKYVIAGGTTQVRRNIIAEIGLGLPRSY